MWARPDIPDEVPRGRGQGYSTMIPVPAVHWPMMPVAVEIDCEHRLSWIVRTQGPHLPDCTIEHRCYGCGQTWRTGFDGMRSLPPEPMKRWVWGKSAPWRGYTSAV